MELLQLPELLGLLRVLAPGLRDSFGPEADDPNAPRSSSPAKFIVSASIAAQATPKPPISGGTP